MGMNEKDELAMRMAECLRELVGEDPDYTNGLMDLLICGQDARNGVRLLKQADAIWKKENDDGPRI